jgi:hypothetical protein
MARADGNPTLDPSKIGPPNWLPLEDAFQRMRARLESSEDAVDELEALLCSRKTRSAIRYVYAGGEVTCHLLDGEFWKNTAYPLLDTDADGVDHIAVHYTDYSLSDRIEFFVRAVDVERWEGYFPTTAAPPPAAEAAPDQQSEDETAPDSSKTRGTGLPTAKPRSRLQQILRNAADETFPNGWGDLPTRTIIEQASRHAKVEALKRAAPSYDTWLRALDRREE